MLAGPPRGPGPKGGAPPATIRMLNARPCRGRRIRSNHPGYRGQAGRSMASSRRSAGGRSGPPQYARKRAQPPPYVNPAARGTQPARRRGCLRDPTETRLRQKSMRSESRLSSSANRVDDRRCGEDRRHAAKRSAVAAAGLGVNSSPYQLASAGSGRGRASVCPAPAAR